MLEEIRGRLVHKEWQQILPEDGASHESQVHADLGILKMLEDVPFHQLHEVETGLMVVFDKAFRSVDRFEITFWGKGY